MSEQPDDMPTPDEQRFHHAADAYVSGNFATARRLIAAVETEDMADVADLVHEIAGSGAVIETMLAVARQTVDFGRCLPRAGALTDGRGQPITFRKWISSAAMSQMDAHDDARRRRDEHDG